MRTRRILTIAILILGAAFVFKGIDTGDFGTVMEKAINICLECIGIG